MFEELFGVGGLFGPPTQRNRIDQHALEVLRERVAEYEQRIERLKRKGQNHIDRAFNRGVDAALAELGPETVFVKLKIRARRRQVRHPEFGTK